MQFTRREQIMTILLVMLMIVVSGVVFWPKEKSAPVVSSPPATAEQNKEPAKSGNVVVYVTGAVKNPGVVAMVHGSRVVDAVNLLGGPTPSADLQGINLAAPLVDGQQIHVPSTADSAGGQTAATVAGKQAGGKININNADAALLDTLPGVGPSTAQRIIDYRNNHGPFHSPDELKNVSGIGESKYQNLKDKIII